MGDTEGFSSPCEMKEGSNRARMGSECKVISFCLPHRGHSCRPQMPASVVITSGKK